MFQAVVVGEDIAEIMEVFVLLRTTLRSEWLLRTGVSRFVTRATGLRRYDILIMGFESFVL